MEPPDDATEPVPRAPRPWAAMLLGASTGLLFAALGVAAWSWWSRRAPVELPPVRETAQVELFRLPPDGDRAALLVPAGPDATGEPRLAAALFPGEDAPRELAALVLANVSPREPWDVDVARETLRGRVAGGEWEEFGLLDGVRVRLSPADDLRLRALGGAAPGVRVEPRTLRQVLVALPKSRKLADLSDVEWGGRTLSRDRLDLGRLRRFREDPAAALSGR